MLICQEILQTRLGRRTYEMSKVPWRDTNGNIRGVLGTGHDITELKDARDELQGMVKSLQRSNGHVELLHKISDRLLGSTAPQAEIHKLCGEVMRFINCDVFINFLTDEQGLRLNACEGLDGARRRVYEKPTHGTTVSCLVAQQAQRIVIERVSDSRLPGADRLSALGITAFACYPLVADGEVMGTLAFGSRQRNSFFADELALMKSAADSLATAIKRERAEEALRRSEALLRTIINGANDPVYLKDREGRVLMGNSATAAALGFSSAGLLENRRPDKASLPGWVKEIDDNDRWVMDNDILATVEEHAPGEQERTFMTSKVPWHDDQGNVIGLISIAQDITERIKMEQELRNTAVALAEKNALITELFINVSHEFRTPLSVLQLAVEILDEHESRGELEPERLRHSIEIMGSNTRRLTRLVGNMVDIARINAGAKLPVFAPVDIAALLRNMVCLVRPYALQKGLKMTLSRHPNSREIYTDAEFVQRIVINLLSNAIKYTPRGGWVHVTYSTDVEGCVITVEDNGEGIPENKQQIIFEHFRRANNTLARSSEGCGIGLSLTKSLAELLGGSIRVKSALGRGSAFTVQLPDRLDAYTKNNAASLPDNLQDLVITELSDIGF
jgi:PAS domain S-box-containing protein